MRSDNLIEAVGNTPLVELPTFNPAPSVHIFAKLEGKQPHGLGEGQDCAVHDSGRAG